MSKNFTKTYAAGQQPKEPQQPTQDEGTTTLRYDLSPAAVEEGIQLKLIEMGWTPPRAEQLAQQEPVAWMNAKRDMTYLYGPYNADDIPLYTTPQAQPAQAAETKRIRRAARNLKNRGEK